MLDTTLCAAIKLLCFAWQIFQLKSSGITLDGHCDSVNPVEINADISMLLSGGK